MADVCDNNENDYFAKFLIRPKEEISGAGYREWLVFGPLQAFAQDMERYYSPDLNANDFLRTHYMESTWNNDGIAEQWHRNDDNDLCPDFLRFTLKKYDTGDQGVELRITRNEQTLAKMRFLFYGFVEALSGWQSANALTYSVKKNFDDETIRFKNSSFGSLS